MSEMRERGRVKSPPAAAADYDDARIRPIVHLLTAGHQGRREITAKEAGISGEKSCPQNKRPSLIAERSGPETRERGRMQSSRQ